MSVATPIKPAPPPVKLPSHRDPYYGGKWQKPAAGRYVEVINPGSGVSLGKVVDGNAADAEAAIAAAKAAFKEWRRVPPLERARMLRAIADVLRKNGEELAMLDAADCGNPYAEMVRDAQVGAMQLDFYAGLVTEMKGASIPMGRTPSTSRCASLTAWSDASSRSTTRSCSRRASRARRLPPGIPWCSSRRSRRRCRRCVLPN